MKKLTLFLNPMHPKRDHNANLVLKLVPYFNCDCTILALNMNESNKNLPADIDGVPIRFVKKHKLFDRILFHSFRLLFGRAHADNLLCTVKTYFKSIPLRIKRKHDAVISTYHMPFPPITASLMGKKTVKALYLMDPTEAMYNSAQTIKNEPKWFLKMLGRQDIVFTTKFIKEAMLLKGYGEYAKRIVEVSFPMITGFSNVPAPKNDGKITLLFAGRIYAGIRSPEYFLKIVSKLDERFRVMFIGQGCEKLVKSTLSNSRAEIIAKPQVPYEQILQEMADADVLINIGNSVPVHLPSKTLEYINTGKPFVNFYKFESCPTLHYTKKYPLCLNVFENNGDIDSVAEEFMDFCINSKGKKLDNEWLADAFSESTPKTIAKTIYSELFPEN